jgi:hypothetical protein
MFQILDKSQPRKEPTVKQVFMVEYAVGINEQQFLLNYLPPEK